MPEHQHQTETAERARLWGGIAAIGGLAIAAISYMGLVGMSGKEYRACDIPKPAEACQTVKEDEAVWLRFLEYGGGLAAVGSLSFAGANALDRRLVAHQFANRATLLTTPTEITLDLEHYMGLMPAPPANLEDSGDWQP